MARRSKQETRRRTRALERLSPFEQKDELMRIAAGKTDASTAVMLNAGRGNPNWVATTPRAAFFALGRFALEESKHAWDAPDLGGMPARSGIAGRLRDFLAHEPQDAGGAWLRTSIDRAVGTLGFDADALVHELTDGVLGDNYPVSNRMLPHCERIVHEYLVRTLGNGRAPRGGCDLFAVEGGTAGMCYVFDSLVQNGLLRPGDTIALATPVFSPYLELPQLDRYRFAVVHVDACDRDRAGRHTWQYPDAEIDKLADPAIKAFFLVNPSNPPSVAIRPATLRRIVRLVRDRRPDLMIVTDDVYATFVDGFRSLLMELPRNTIGVYSFSKYFGCTGWRLGVLALHRRNVFDEALGRLPQATRRALSRRYAGLTLEPAKLAFIDRLVADSRQVALKHTAGLSTPQQVQMALFALFGLADDAERYRQQTRAILAQRMRKLAAGLHVDWSHDALHADYYATIDLAELGRAGHGAEFDRFAAASEPLEVLLILAERYGIVLLGGGGFAAPDWSVRISLANLDDAAYERIGDHLRDSLAIAMARWRRRRRH